LNHRYDEAGLDRYEADLEREDQFVRVVQETRRTLMDLYAVADDLSTEQKKSLLLSEMQRQFSQLASTSPEYRGYAAWFRDDLNNAKLNSVATYFDLVPAFEGLLAHHENDLDRFYGAVRELKALGKADRHAELGSAASSLASASGLVLPAGFHSTQDEASSSLTRQ
jgi:predicted aminopeptidase